MKTFRFYKNLNDENNFVNIDWTTIDDIKQQIPNLFSLVYDAPEDSNIAVPFYNENAEKLTDGCFVTIDPLSEVVHSCRTLLIANSFTQLKGLFAERECDI